MKNNTDQMLYLAKILLGMALGFTIILFLINLGIYAWGYANPDIFDKGLWLVDLKNVLLHNKWQFIFLGILNSVYIILFAWLFVNAIAAINKLNLQKPFNVHLQERINTMALIIISIAFLKIGVEKLSNIRQERPVINLEILEGQLFTLSIGCILFVLGLIVKKGLEIQNENEYTI